MDWNGNLRVPNFVSRPESSLSFLYNYNNYHDQFPDMTKQATAASSSMNIGNGMMCNGNISMNNNNGYVDPKKKRLSNEQLEMLENNFHEEIKLDPDRKMKLAKELGLQPRQIAVWFQNRRARWKSKQLERLYDSLKHEYDAVSRDKLKLQQEVMALRAILNKEAMVGKKQISSIGGGGGGGYTEISGEETMESTSSDQNQNPPPPPPPPHDPTAIDHNLQQHINNYADINSNQDNYTLTMEYHHLNDDFNNNAPIVMPPYWPASATLP